MSEQTKLVEAKNASYNAGIRVSITWLHQRAEQMADPVAKSVLHSAAYHLGIDKPNAVAQPPVQPTPSEGSRAELNTPDATDGRGEAVDTAWKRYENDFNAMTDQQIAEETRRSEDQLAEAEDWLEAVASWEAAGKPRIAHQALAALEVKA